MDLVTRVNALASTTFSGRRFTRQQIIEIAQTVNTYSKLSRSELALTLCEHLDWKTPGQELKINSALELLDKLESLEICQPPSVSLLRKRGPDKVVPLVLPVEQSPYTADLAEVSPVTLKVVEQGDERRRFNTLMAAHHYLSYKRPFGAHLRYFILDKDGRELGLFLFAASAWSLKSRDEWLGWERRHRIKRLHLVVSNSRFLIFPWVNVPNLASKALSLITARLADDWQARYGYRPVLIETFVDREKYVGTCYQAANWVKVGETTGRGRFDKTNVAGETIKTVYVQPLAPNFRDVLLRGESAAQLGPSVSDMQDRLSRVHDNVLAFWTTVAPLIRSIAEEFDSAWQIKRRVIDSMLLVLLIFRLVATRAKHGYGTTIDELWDNCRKQGLPLPQKKPIAASAFTVARLKLDEQIFKTINSRVISHYEEIFDRAEYRFFGHRLYAVDGSKINLPRRLLQDGFKTPNDGAHYPQGLLSGLYRLKAKIPADFVLTSDCNERRVALTHLTTLTEGDIVVYDRGYFSYGFLHAHIEQGVHPVFRLNTHTYAPIKKFMESTDTDRVVVIEPQGEKRRAKIRKSNPGIDIRPLNIRLIKYEVAGITYYLGTTLLDARFSPENFKDLYHARWGIEELYKISKHFIAIEEFHAKSLRGVRQELYAHMALVTLNRVLTNHTDDTHQVDNHQSPRTSAGRLITNFKSSMAVVARNLESLLLDKVQPLYETITSVLASLARRYQAVRPNRSYPRRSLKPQARWQPAKEKAKKMAA